jgi:DnaK suppressor protein
MPAGTKSGLNKLQLKEFEKRLLTEKTRLEKALGKEVTCCDQSNDVGDRSSSEQLVALTVAEQSRSRKDLAAIMGALERIKKGSFGECQSPDCDGDSKISVGRLNAMPTASFCIECMAEREKALKKK